MVGTRSISYSDGGSTHISKWLEPFFKDRPDKLIFLHINSAIFTRSVIHIEVSCKLVKIRFVFLRFRINKVFFHIPSRSIQSLFFTSPKCNPDRSARCNICLLYTSDAADDLLCVDLGGRCII